MTAPWKVLIVDDSAAARRALARMLETVPELEVVGRAASGEEGLRLAMELMPDVITLDLEMPTLDGYGFLRLLLARVGIPVIVVSSYGHPADVFKALQLGAVDFVALKGSKLEASEVRAELVTKLLATRNARVERRTPAPEAPATKQSSVPVVLIGASTGGPPAIQRVLESLGGLSFCAVVAQHMPAPFTRAFADRLDELLPFHVTEARTGDVIAAGRVFVAPGGSHLELTAHESVTRLSVKMRGPHERYAPSIDRLFSSAARLPTLPRFGLILTGMGDDGAAGALELKQSGVEVWAEAESSAVVFGMPEAAIRAKAVSQVLPVGELGPALAKALRSVPKR